MKQGVLVIVWEAVKAVFNEAMNFLVGESLSVNEKELVSYNNELQKEIKQKSNDIHLGLNTLFYSIDEAGNAVGTLNELVEYVQEQPGKYTEIEKEEPKIHNCKNCGAPLHNNKCEYCETEY